MSVITAKFISFLLFKQNYSLFLFGVWYCYMLYSKWQQVEYFPPVTCMEHSAKEMAKSEIRNLVHMQHSIDK